MKLVLLFRGTAREVWKEFDLMVRTIPNVTLKELAPKEG